MKLLTACLLRESSLMNDGTDLWKYDKEFYISLPCICGKECNVYAGYLLKIRLKNIGKP